MLSRWVRERLVDINSFDELESRLENFVDERKHEAIQSGSSGLSRREEAKLSKAKAVKRKTSGGVDFGQSQSKPKPKLNCERSLREHVLQMVLIFLLISFVVYSSFISSPQTPSSIRPWNGKPGLRRNVTRHPALCRRIRKAVWARRA